MALLKMVGLEGFERKYPCELSGGMQQHCGDLPRFGECPKILLMDEPFDALDAMTRDRMNGELQKIHLETRKTALLITYSILEAVFLADRVVVMTKRPGSIAAIYDVPIAKPRRLGAISDPVFLELTGTIRRHFNAEIDGY
jgi:NitT/TauT family transport system ATP-binding protein